MLAARWQPLDVWAEMSRLHDEMSRAFGRTTPESREFGSGFPALNLWEQDDRLIVEAELPGFCQEDIDVSVEAGDHLIIKGERKAVELPESSSWYRRERATGQFARTIPLPVGVNAEQVEARFCNGVLTVELPKREEVKPRRIEVKVV